MQRTVGFSATQYRPGEAVVTDYTCVTPTEDAASPQREAQDDFGVLDSGAEELIVSGAGDPSTETQVPRQENTEGTTSPPSYPLAPETVRNGGKIRPIESNVTVFSQNVQGSKDPIVIEHAIHISKQDQIDIFCLQETWLTGKWSKRIDGWTIFHYGPEEATCNRGSGGVAIILSPKALRAWKKAGSKDPIYGGTQLKTTRFMACI